MSASLAAELIQKNCPQFKADIGLILGSGLGSVVEQIEVIRAFDYSELPGFPVCSVSGHQGQLIVGQIAGRNVICLSGRSHPYEGENHASYVKTCIRTLRLCGANTLVTTSATGSLHQNVGPGSIVIINDHINLQFSNPLVGPNDDEFGPRFVPMADIYDPKLRALLHQAAETQGIAVTEGVYCGTIGPSFETAAEVRACRLLGGDVVGMSTIPEVLIAVHCGLRVAALSIVTNYATGLQTEALAHDVTLAVAAQASANVKKLLLEFLRLSEGESS